jgi:hypothetical protein
MVEQEMLDLSDASKIINVMPKMQEIGRVRYVILTSPKINPKDKLTLLKLQLYHKNLP